MESIKYMSLALYNRFRQLILYGIIGGFCASLDFFIFYSLTTYLDVYYLIANVISVSAGITISFLLNRKYNFKVKDNALRRFMTFASIGLGGLLLSSVLLYFFFEILSLEKFLSKILSIILVVLLQFLLNKYITFKKSNYE
ncbi:MAG: GtrA family protein [Bacteroidota bacterium]|nr:GtrA family protein [Bacteroidota bacterium]